MSMHLQAKPVRRLRIDKGCKAHSRSLAILSAICSKADSRGEGRRLNLGVRFNRPNVALLSQIAKSQTPGSNMHLAGFPTMCLDLDLKRKGA